MNARLKPGHWEGDLITGAKNSHVATLVERYSRYVILVRVGGKDSASVVGALIERAKQLPQGLLLSLTWDRGTELAMHKLFTKETGVPVYFCDPKSPWHVAAHHDPRECGPRSRGVSDRQELAGVAVHG